MEFTYSSSFESEDDEVGQLQDPQDLQMSNSSVRISDSNTVGKSVELDLLCKGVSDLPLATDTGRQVGTNTSWFFDSKTKSIDKNSLPSDCENKTLKDQYGQTRNFLKPVFNLKRSVSSFTGSASINRRKKLKQIEHDNLILLKKLQNVKPSSDVTEWKKRKRASSALSNQMTKETTRTQRSAP